MPKNNDNKSTKITSYIKCLIEIMDYSRIDDLKKEDSEKNDSKNDISDIKKIKEEAYIPPYKKRNPEINLGIYNSHKWGIRSDKYCGYSWLKDQNNKILKNDKDGEDIILHIKPRFGLDFNKMLQTIASDEEFFDYLGLETDDPMICFFHDEPMIENVNVEENLNLLISVISFIALLDRTTRVSVIKKMVKVEENAVGRVRGHILMNKNISRNICQGHIERIYATHNERSENIRENRMLLYVLNKAEDYFEQSNKEIISSVRMMISVIRNRLSRVELMQNEIFSCDDIDRMIIKLPNIYRNYVLVFEYAKLILNESSVNAGEGTGARIIPYAINSHMLYECYVRACIKNIIKEIKDDDYTIEMMRYVRDKENIPNDDNYGAQDIIKGNKKCYISGKVVPDIVIKYTPVKQEGETFYRVFDVKYKDSSKRYKGRDDRLQLLAYNLIYYPIKKYTGFIMPESSGLEYGKIINTNMNLNNSVSRNDENEDKELHGYVFSEEEMGKLITP